MASSTSTSTSATKPGAARQQATIVGATINPWLSAAPVVGRPLQRSTPELLLTENRKSNPNFDTNFNEMKTTTTDEYKVPFSRSFTGRTASGYSRTSSSSTVDTRNVQVYLRRQGSRASLHSSASAGLVTSDNASSASSSHSRPVSADANNAANSTPAPPSAAAANSIVSPTHPPSAAANTRFVLPRSPSMPRAFPPSLMTPISRSTSIPSLAARRRSSYLDKMVCRVCDYLYMGGIEAAYNANLLCRLNIEYVIDISNVEPLKVPRNKRSDCPCLCSLTTAHSRVRMTIMIEENSQLDLIPYFDDVNRFIDSARSCNKSVLVHSYDGRNRCAALVVQYLMKTRKLSLDRSLDFLRSMRSDINVGENFLKSLRKWDSAIQQSRTGAAVDNDGGGGDRELSSANDSQSKIVENVRPFIGPFHNQKTTVAANGTPSTKRSAWV